MKKLPKPKRKDIPYIIVGVAVLLSAIPLIFGLQQDESPKPQNYTTESPRVPQTPVVYVLEVEYVTT